MTRKHLIGIVAISFVLLLLMTMTIVAAMVEGVNG
jgi:hypothetical protein